MGINVKDVDGISLDGENVSSDDDDYYLPPKRDTIRGNWLMKYYDHCSASVTRLIVVTSAPLLN